MSRLALQGATDELHFSLEVPRHTARQIFLWAQSQDWPEGTELEPPSEYHVTLLYTPSGYEEHKDAWWLEHMEGSEVEIQGFSSFPAQEKGYAYVLRLDAPDVKDHADMLQGRAEAMGLEITHFPGGYKPHLTVGYGPTKVTGIKVPNFQFDIGPSSVSPPRIKDNDNPIRTVSAQLHHAHKQSGCLNSQLAIDHAARVLRYLGYPTDRITIQAAIQTWQTEYPDDEVEISDDPEKFAPDVSELSQTLGDDRHSTVPTQVNNPEDHWPEFGELPPDRKHDVQFSNDWAWHQG